MQEQRARVLDALNQGRKDLMYSVVYCLNFITMTQSYQQKVILCLSYSVQEDRKYMKYLRKRLLENRSNF